MARRRGFQEISVTRLGYQTAVQRFGIDSRPVDNPLSDDSEGEDEDEEEGMHAMPKVEMWRMNLTALSQHHNLYFAAYCEKIYVYKPQGSQQILPATPFLILEPPQDQEVVHAHNPLERYGAHIINHIILGNLGNKEILLASNDGGDVVAYYTDAIEDTYQVSATNQIISIRPFFAENVGNGAWGLAIHQHSRLIAVGSNSHEVQVFAFALSPLESEKPECKANSISFSEGSVRFPKVKQRDIPRTEDGRIARDRGFRLVFHLPPVGHNIPAISFADDTDGEAETIVAKDIKGAVWFYRIWEPKWKRLPTTAEEAGPNGNPVGWGVVVLPRNFFKPTYTQTETYGHPKSSIVFSNFKIDITRSLRYVRGSTLWHEDFDGSDEEVDTDGESDEGGGDVEDSGTDLDVEEAIDEPDFSTEPVREDPDSIMVIADEASTGIFSATTPAARLVPPAAPTPPLETFPLSLEFDDANQASENPVLTTSRSISHLITSGALILHTNRYSVTILPSSDLCRPTFCNNVLRQDYPHDASFPRPLSDYDRLNMILTIPELSLVLVASQVGRVALMTITRPMDRNKMLTGTVAMRVDRILPFTHEEIVEKVRPSFGLLGMAVGPMQRERVACKRNRMSEACRSSVPKGGAEFMREARMRPRRWRLLLHYHNHTILSYEISRDEETDELMIL